MAVTAVVGAQWGDEGKGKIVDLLAQQSDIVVRFGGGSNAGHTIVNEFGSFKLHSLPSGALNPGTLNVVGTGTVVDFNSLSAELELVRAAGVSNVRLAISDRAHVVMPFHKALDRMKEEAMGSMRVGTTGQGIGPCYVDKVDRVGVQAGELLDLDRLEDRLGFLLDLKNRTIRHLYKGREFGLSDVMERMRAWVDEFGYCIQDTTRILAPAIAADQRILLEGQLGVMRDLDWGTYPYVTSSTTFAAGAGSGAGIPASSIHDVVAVVKAYTTAVGEGPLPTEIEGDEAETLRRRGNEYGATTGRPRRVGWLDAVALRYAVAVGAFTELALTKLDILDGAESIKIAVGYEIDGVPTDDFPHPSRLGRVTPVFETLPGWKQPAAGARSWATLPENAKRYVSRIEELAGVPVTLIGVGQERDSVIVVDNERAALSA